jgi:hypothetical protein
MLDFCRKYWCNWQMSRGRKAVQEKEAYEPILSDLDYRLLNGRQLAECLGVKYDFVKDMRLVGFNPPMSGLTTLTYAREWLNRHPNFREDARILKLSRRPRLVVSLQRRGVGKSDSPRLTRGGLRSSRRLQNGPLELAA